MCHPKISKKNKYNPEPKAVPLLILYYSVLYFYLSPLSDDDAWIANPNTRTDWHFDR